MIVSCPECGARYSLDAKAIGKEGRKVRCSKCQHVWQQAPAVDLPKSTVNEKNAQPTKLSTGQSEGKSIAVKPLLGWGVFALILLTFMVTFYTARQSIVKSWPPAAKLYEFMAIDFGVVGYGLKIVNIQSESVYELDGKYYFKVYGDIINTTDQKMQMPEMICLIYNSENSVVQWWKFEAEATAIDPRGKMSFKTRLQNPPLDSVGFDIKFIASDETGPDLSDKFRDKISLDETDKSQSDSSEAQEETEKEAESEAADH